MKTPKITSLFLIVLMAACSSAISPSKTLREYIIASENKNPAMMKQFLSKDSLQMLEKSAKAQNITLDELLIREAEVQHQTVPDIRNETIESDTATVEAKNSVTGEFDMKIPFVKEDGTWKIARDKYIADEIKKMNEQMNIPVNASPSDKSLTNSNSK